jgi:hypothetical protein
MKQLTIFCSRDEETRVVAALDAAGVEGYLRVGSATGNKFLEAGRVPRTMSWEAAMFVVPALPEERARAVVQTLGDYARDCEIEPCLRMVLSPVDEAC